MSQGEKNEKLYPLSPLNNLIGHNYDVYKTYLNTAIKNPRVKNIAITGDFGIGKSSILKTFCRDTNNNFMFLSLAEYNNVQQDKFTNGDTKNGDINDRKKLESSLLRQIISLCHNKEIPQSGLRLVQEESIKFKKKFLAILLCIDIFVILLVLFRNVVSELLHSMFGEKSDFHSIYLFLYIIIFIFSILIFGILFYSFISRTEVKEISASISNSNAEISATAQNTEFYLERYSIELTYIFEMLSKNYDAIVFEDMDRINYKIAIEILTCLREINNTVNERLRANFENKKTIKKFLIQRN